MASWKQVQKQQNNLNLVKKKVSPTVEARKIKLFEYLTYNLNKIKNYSFILTKNLTSVIGWTLPLLIISYAIGGEEISSRKC